MIRLFHVHFPTRTLVLSASEICLIVLAFLAVSVARSADEIELWLAYENGFLKIAVVSAVLICCMYYYDLYDSIVLGNRRETLARLFQVFGTASIVLAILYFLYPQARLGRASFILGIGLAGFGIGFSRQLFFSLNRSGRLAERVAIVGGGSLAVSLAQEIEKRPELGLRVLGLVSQSDFANHPTKLRHLGKIEDLTDLVMTARITCLLVATEDHGTSLPITELRELKSHGLRILDGAAYYEQATGKVFLDSNALVRLLYSPRTCPSPALLVYKRAASVVFSMLALILSAPLMAAVAIAVSAESKGPVLFRQRRVGRDGKLFTLYKFRSMWSDGDGKGPFKPAQLNDERVTRVGHWLRRVRLDELPQLYNILRGDMHFVGPRPFAFEEEKALAEEIPHYSLRWSIKPGATGWAQVQQGYCSSVQDNAEKLAHDLFYIQNLSVGLDLLILLRTTKILLWGRGAR